VQILVKNLVTQPNTQPEFFAQPTLASNDPEKYAGGRMAKDKKLAARLAQKMKNWECCTRGKSD
jgi:hypothetical protein